MACVGRTNSETNVRCQSVVSYSPVSFHQWKYFPQETLRYKQQEHDIKTEEQLDEEHFKALFPDYRAQLEMDLAGDGGGASRSISESGGRSSSVSGTARKGWGRRYIYEDVYRKRERERERSPYYIERVYIYIATVWIYRREAFFVLRLTC